MALTLWGKNYDAYHLRRSRRNWRTRSSNWTMFPKPRSSAGSRGKCAWCSIRSGWPPMASRQPRSWTQLQSANTRGQAGSFARDNREFQVEAGNFFTRAEDLQQVVVGVHAGRPVYLRDVAEKLEDGPAEPDNYVLFANAHGWRRDRRPARNIRP